MGIENFDLTEDQDRALAAVRSGARVLVLNGHAGTGKTTLLWMISRSFGGGCLILAPTGKAARRVSEVTGLPAKTMHSWLYLPIIDTETWEISYERKSSKMMEAIGDIPASKIVIVDEASMVTEELWNDLREVCNRLGLKVILVGDEFQLPPVGSEGFSVFGSRIGRQYKLTHVVRQAANSKVLRAANYIREGNVNLALDTLVEVREDDVRFFAPPPGPGVIICHRNDTRLELNNRIRKLYKFNGPVQTGEPIVINRNNYILEWMNGDMFPFGQVLKAPVQHRVTWEEGIMDTRREVSTMLTYFTASLNGKEVVLCGEELFGVLPRGIKPGRVNYGAIAWAFTHGCTERMIIEGKETTAPRQFANANLGWTLTCHKAQGSQWDSVMVFIEPTVKLNTEYGQRWLYTSVTRAVTSAVIVHVGWKLRRW